VTGRALFKAWRPVILGAFIFAAVATPSSDPWTMTALAMPMLVLFAAAATMCLVLDKRRRRREVDGLDYTTLDDDLPSTMDDAATPLDDRPEPVDDPGRHRLDDDDIT
jgi:sec-independent protein translocase protein TatC